MKLAIVGSRTFTDYEVFQTILLEHYQISEIETIISGGATGSDTLAEKFAHQYNRPILVIKPEWSRYGRSAGIRRNRQIIERSTHVIAFWDGVCMELKIQSKRHKN